jgi:hypothetical protein
MATHEPITITRRQAAALSAAFVALPATALAAEPSPHPDQALLDLNAELEARWRTAWELYGPTRVAVDAAEAEVARRTVGKYPSPVLSEDEFQTWWKVLTEVRKEYGCEDLNRRCEAAWEHLDEVLYQIFAVRPTTLTGTAVWARAVATVHHKLWDETDIRELDWGKQVTRRLIEQTVAAGGLELPWEIEVVT